MQRSVLVPEQFVKLEPLRVNHTIGFKRGEVLGIIVLGFGGMVIEAGIMSDHVHLPIELPPRVAVWKFIRTVEGRSFFASPTAGFIWCG
jgi:hypothetical protein